MIDLSSDHDDVQPKEELAKLHMTPFPEGSIFYLQEAHNLEMAELTPGGEAGMMEMLDWTKGLLTQEPAPAPPDHVGIMSSDAMVNELEGDDTYARAAIRTGFALPMCGVIYGPGRGILFYVRTASQREEWLDEVERIMREIKLI